MVNVSIHHNITFECGNFVCFHIYDSTQTSTIFGVNYAGVKIDNNLAVTRKRDPGFILLADGQRLKDSTLIQIRNNIFASDSLGGGFVYENMPPSNKSSYTHTNNIVWCPLRNPFAHGEKAAVGEVYANPLFTDSLWDKPGTLDSTVGGYVPQAISPAAGNGAILGYSTDYLGNDALPAPWWTSVRWQSDRCPLERARWFLPGKK